jgi:hypothetical protein
MQSQDGGTMTMRRGLAYGLRNAPEALWRIVVEETAELPAFQDLAERAQRFRDPT